MIFKRGASKRVITSEQNNTIDAQQFCVIQNRKEHVFEILNSPKKECLSLKGVFVFELYLGVWESQ